MSKELICDQSSGSESKESLLSLCYTNSMQACICWRKWSENYTYLGNYTAQKLIIADGFSANLIGFTME